MMKTRNDYENDDDKDVDDGNHNENDPELAMWAESPLCWCPAHAYMSA